MQREAIRQWAKLGGRKVAVLQTAVISGASELRDRAGCCEAAALDKSGGSSGVVMARLDRLARGVTVQELLLGKLSDRGGVVLSTRENEMLNGESEDPSRKRVRVIMDANSEYDREMTVDRLATGREAKAAHGGCAHGALPYGYRSITGRLVPVPAERIALAAMNAARAGRESE